MDKLINTSVSSSTTPVNTTLLANTTSLTSQVAGPPQIQTTMQDNKVETVSILNAPFIQVTSVNGMTGDVTLQTKIEPFKANQYYQAGSVTTHQGALYIAKQDFTATSTFNPANWTKVEAQAVQPDWNQTDSTSSSFIKNKPTTLKAIEPSYTPFTTEEKTKLQGIENGAQKNVPQVQADWNNTSSSSPAFIKNKPSNLVQDPNYVHTDNNFTTAEKLKLSKNFVEGGEKAIPGNYVNFQPVHYVSNPIPNIFVSVPAAWQKRPVPGTTLYVPVKPGEEWKLSVYCDYLSNAGDSGGEVTLRLILNDTNNLCNSIIAAPVPSMGRMAQCIYKPTRQETLKLDAYLDTNQPRNMAIYGCLVFAERWR